MKTMRRGLFALTAGCALLAGCGVGAYHIPNVEPVIKPPPEEDMFGDLDLESGGSAGSTGTEQPKSEEGAKPEGAAPEGAATGTEAKPAETKGETKETKAGEGKPAEGTEAAEPKKGTAKTPPAKPVPKKK